MSERASYEPGTPSWVDLSTPDPAAAKEFYGALFGWEAVDPGPPEETGGYAMFTLRGKNVAGVGPLMSEEQPAVWSTYVSTDDADAAVARAREAGGDALVEPMDVMDAGRMAFVFHPAAGAVGIWQPARHTGAELVNEPGAFTWSQLHTRDREAAIAFYGKVFGWTAGDFGGMPMLSLGDRGVATAMDMPPGTPDGVPPFWMVIFAAADTDATAARAQELGGQVVAEPFDIENVGRFAVLADPQGVAFGVITAPPEQS
jgi:predicted enzyme related to lactoylglutathione lyase